MFTDWEGVRCLGHGTRGPGRDETGNLRVHIGLLVLYTEVVMSALSAWVAGAWSHVRPCDQAGP